MTRDGADPQRPAAVDLAHAPDFDLGRLSVRPSLCEVAAGGRRMRLQPRVMQVLVVLARADGEVVSRDDLVERCWGGLAVSEDAINRCIGLLRRLAEQDARGSFAIETLPRIGYRLSTSVSPAGEALPAPRRRGPARRFGPWTLAVGALAVGGLAGLAALAWFGLGRPGWSTPDDGIAVAPFSVSGSGSGADPTARAFADGVAYEVASALAKTDLKPIAADAGSQPAGAPPAAGDRDAAAVRLGAAFALDGRVQHDAHAIAVSVNLDDPRRRAVLWSARFTRGDDQAQALQEQVAAKIADVLHCALNADRSQRSRMDGETMSLYLRACDLRRDPDAQDQSRDLLRQVLGRQPRFARAWAEFAVASLAASGALPADQAAAARRDAEAAARTALKLDPRDGLAYAALSELAGDAAAGKALVLKGLAVDPDNALLANKEAGILMAAGRTHEAAAYGQRAVAVEPLSPVKTANLAEDLAYDGRLAEARALAERAARIWPDNREVLTTRLVIEGYWGDPDRALALAADPAARPSDWEPSTLAQFRRFVQVRKAADPARVAAFARDTLADVRAGRAGPTFATLLLADLGATDAAFDAAGSATPAHPLGTFVLFQPSAAALRADPRFMPLAARLGLVAGWRASGHWPDFCLAPDRPYDCAAAAARLGGR